MRKFLYKHHKLTVALVHILALLCAALGFVLAIIASPTEELNTEGTVFLFGGIILALFIELGANLISPFKYGMQLLGRLGKLSRGRKSFSLGEKISTEGKLEEISRRLEEKGYAPKIAKAQDGFVGRWCRVSSVIGERNVESYSSFSLNFYLYKAENLDKGVWESIKGDLSERLGCDREEQRDKKGRVGIVNSVCVLCDFADSQVIEQARKTLSVKLGDTLTLTGIRLCVGIPKNDIYYLSTERELDSNSRTNKSLETVALAVFGVGVGRLNKLGNGYTDEYIAELERAYESSLSSLAAAAREKSESDRQQEEKQWREDPVSSLKEGEMLRRGDAIYCLCDGILADSFIMLPKDALESFEEDFGDIEDMLGELDEESEPYEAESDEPAPTVPEDYKGKIVLSTSDYGLTLPKGKLKKLSKEQRARVFAETREYLLSCGFESVYFYNEKKKTIDET